MSTTMQTEMQAEATPETGAKTAVGLPRRRSRRILKAYAVWITAFVAAGAILFIAASGPAVQSGLAETALSLLTWQMLVIMLAALACEYVDSTLGMGYGTTLTPALLLAGFQPLAIVPAVLLSELVTGITSGIMHHGAGNVNFRRGSRHRHVAMVLAACSVVGTLVAVAISIQIPKWALKGYIGLLVLGIGITILVTRNRTFAFSWKRITGLGLLAAFNKGMSGGGYGPVVAGGQVLSGMDAKQAVGITSMAEGLTCVVGAALYMVTTGIDSRLALPLVIGAMLSVPLSVHSVRAVRDRHLRLAIGALTLILGAVTLIRLVW